MHSNFPFSAVRYLYRKSSITSPGGGGGLIYLKHIWEWERGGA